MRDRKAEKILIEVVRRLCEERQRQKLSIKKLAALSGVSRTGLSHIEKGERSPTLVNCLRIADALGLRLGDVLNSISDEGGRES